jgi:hypothetical protein
MWTMLIVVKTGDKKWGWFCMIEMTMRMDTLVRRHLALQMLDFETQRMTGQ